MKLLESVYTFTPMTVLMQGWGTGGTGLVTSMCTFMAVLLVVAWGMAQGYQFSSVCPCLWQWQQRVRIGATGEHVHVWAGNGSMVSRYCNGMGEQVCSSGQQWYSVLYGHSCASREGEERLPMQMHAGKAMGVTVGTSMLARWHRGGCAEGDLGGLVHVVRGHLLKLADGHVESGSIRTMICALGRHPGWASKSALQIGTARLGPWDTPANRRVLRSD